MRRWSAFILLLLSLSTVCADDNVPPQGRSAFDDLIQEIGGVPKTFRELRDAIEQKVGLKLIRAPMLQSRGLTKDSVNVNQPRDLIATKPESFSNDHFGTYFRYKNMYIAYTPELGTYEVLSRNEKMNRFEFQVIDKAGKVSYPPRELCMSCHEEGVPIFSEAPWSEGSEYNFRELASSTYFKSPENLFNDRDVANNGAGAYQSTVLDGGAWLASERFLAAACGSGAASGPCRTTFLKSILIEYESTKRGSNPSIKGVDRPELKFYSDKNWPKEGVPNLRLLTELRDPKSIGVSPADLNPKTSRDIIGKRVSSDQATRFLLHYFNGLISPDEFHKVLLPAAGGDINKLVATLDSPQVKVALESDSFDRRTLIDAMFTSLDRPSPLGKYLSVTEQTTFTIHQPEHLSRSPLVETLNTHCLRCHSVGDQQPFSFLKGTDEEINERLASPEFRSTLLKRIETQNDSERMPPPRSKEAVKLNLDPNGRKTLLKLFGEDCFIRQLDNALE